MRRILFLAVVTGLPFGCATTPTSKRRLGYEVYLERADAPESAGPNSIRADREAGSSLFENTILKISFPGSAKRSVSFLLENKTDRFLEDLVG